jgi:hypothetical protein
VRVRNGGEKDGLKDKKRECENARRAAAAARANGEDERGAKRERKEGTERASKERETE